jgi:tripartite-type tricarboxylate transporter receptor subunit TctC
MNKINYLYFFIAGAAGIACAQPQPAPAWPQRPVRVIVNVSAGGGVDMVARIAALHMGSAFGQTFVVDNRTGAGGMIGTELAAKAAPDGYTLLVSSNTAITTAAVRKTSYDPVRDFQAVSKLTSNPYIVCVAASTPVSNMRELIALARSRPGGLTYGSAGMGSILHLASALIGAMAKAPMLNVPYKGVADVYPAGVSGQVDWVVGSPISALPFIKGGRLKGIAVTGGTRARTLPDLPTVAESGLPGYEVIAWYGMLAPAKTPMAIVDKLQGEARRALQAPPVLRRMEIEGTDVVAGTPSQFAVDVKAEFDKWRGLARKTGLGGQG